MVSTEPLAELYRHEIDDIAVVPNRLEKARWLACRGTRHRAKPGKPGRPLRRLGRRCKYRGRPGVMIREVVETPSPKRVDWVFFRHDPGRLRTLHQGVPRGGAPRRLPVPAGSLALDLAVAPLEVNLFNERRATCA